MMTETQHWDVGAYVLGVLDPAEIESFEAHLAICDDCADEVESLLPVVGILATVDSAAVVAHEAEASRAGRWQLPAKAPSRRSRRNPRHGNLEPAATGHSRLMVAASIIVLIVAGLSFAVGTQFGATEAPAAIGEQPTPTATASAATAAQNFEATDPKTGVNARLAVTAVPWGAKVDMSLGGVRGPLRCELVAIDAKSNSTVVASWIVPDAGYGVPAQPNMLRLQASTSAMLATTTRYEIRAVGPAGAVTNLLTVPV